MLIRFRKLGEGEGRVTANNLQHLRDEKKIRNSKVAENLRCFYCRGLRLLRRESLLPDLVVAQSWVTRGVGSLCVANDKTAFAFSLYMNIHLHCSGRGLSRGTSSNGANFELVTSSWKTGLLSQYTALGLLFAFTR